MHPERDLVIAIAAARHREGQMIEDAFTKTLVEGEPMRRRQIDPRLPFLRAAFAERFRRNPELHECPPSRSCFSFGSDYSVILRRHRLKLQRACYLDLWPQAAVTRQ